MMKAAIYTEYGPPEVLRIVDVPIPEPGERDILIKVRATTVSAADYRLRSFTVPSGYWIPARVIIGLLGPKQKILGNELAGEVVAAGSGVTRFKVGDRVFGEDLATFGGYAEYAVRSEGSALALIPDQCSYEEAVALTGGVITALVALRDLVAVATGQKIVVYGASGSVGVAAVQLAKHFGAQVTAVCSGANSELVKNLGADEVIDYTSEDFTTNGKTYDIIFDTVGKRSFGDCKDSLMENGVYLVTGNTLWQSFQMLWRSITGGKQVITPDKTTKGAPPPESPENMDSIKEMFDTGALKPVIDRTYPLDQIVEAHRYAEQGHKKGNVVVVVDGAMGGATER